MRMTHQLSNMLVSVTIKRGGCLVQDQKSASSDQHMYGYEYEYINFDDKMTLMMTIAKDENNKQ